MKIVYGLGLIIVLLLISVSCKAPKKLPPVKNSSQVRVLKNDKNSMVVLTEEDILNAVKEAK